MSLSTDHSAKLSPSIARADLIVSLTGMALIIAFALVQLGVQVLPIVAPGM